MDLMSYSFVNFATFLISTGSKCHICDIIVLIKLTLTQSKVLDALIGVHVDESLLKLELYAR